VAFAAGVGSGLVFLLVLFASVRIAERLYPPPPDVFIWLFPVVLGAGFAAVVCGLLCGSGLTLILRRLLGEAGRVRVKPIVAMSLVWIVVPPLAFPASARPFDRTGRGSSLWSDYDRVHKNLRCVVAQRQRWLCLLISCSPACCTSWYLAPSWDRGPDRGFAFLVLRGE
jgi:hypothetical protein